MLTGDPPKVFPLPAAGQLRTRSFASSRTIFALMLREMITTYGRSPGGYLWAVLEPAAGISLLSVVFSMGFHSPALGISFPMFYATGMVPFVFFNDINLKVSRALLFSKPLMAYPTVTFVDAIFARFLLNVVTQLLIGYFIFTGIILLFDTRVIPNIAVIAQSFALVALLSIGIGVLNCFLMTKYEIWQRVWSILMRPMFIASCTFFLLETIPEPYRGWLWFNPLVHVIGLMRRGFYPTYDANYVSTIYVAGIGLGTLALGLLFLRRYHRDLLHS